jgi:hypothetical protein
MKNYYFFMIKIMSKIIVLLLTLFSSFIIFSKESMFDKIIWEKVYESNGVILCVQKDKNEKLNYYKAEKTVASAKSEDFFKNIIDFENYSKIFPRTTIFKQIKELGENKFIIYSSINFKPLKSRDYYIIFEYSVLNVNGNKQYIAEWYPVSSEDFKMDSPIKNHLRVKNINGRWIIKESGSGKTEIRFETHNDFELNVPKSAAYPYEINSTVDAIEDLINYTLKK